MRTQLPPRGGHNSPRPTFRLMYVVVKRLDGSRCHLVYGGRPRRPRRQCVRLGPSSQRKGDSSPHFSAHVYCGQTPGWIKLPLRTEVGLRPGDIVLHGDPAPPRKGVQQPPTFRPTLVRYGRPSQQLLSSCSNLKWVTSYFRKKQLLDFLS